MKHLIWRQRAPDIDFARSILIAALNICHACNNRCLGCSQADVSSNGVLPKHIVLDRLQRVKETLVSTVVFCGGEPSIRSDFFDIARSAIDCGLGFGLMTNGRMFSYKDFADTYTGLNPDFTQVTIYSADMETHDKLSGVKGSFAQTIAGLRNISGKTQNINILIPIHKLNMNSVGEIPILAEALGVSGKIKFSAAASAGIGCGGDLGDTSSVVEMADVVSNSIKKAASANRRNSISFHWEGLAPCQIKEFPSLGVEPLDEDIAIVWAMESSDFTLVASSPIADSFSEDCLVCSRRSSCFSSRREPRSPFIENIPNSAGYKYSRTVATEQSPTCPAGEHLCATLHPLRDVALMRNNEIEIYSADGNCHARTLHGIKFYREQLYLNVSGLSRNLDFRTAFKRLALCAECRECSRRATCSGLFVATNGNAFAGIEKKEFEWLSNIKGAALDIGCGKPLFPDLLKSKIMAGELDYVGVDRYPECSGELNTSPVDIEEFEWEGPLFDHIMMLRSYNHFRDPRIVIRKARELLRPDGLLHIFDNSIFGTLKRNVVDNPTENDRPPHQHYRNHFSEEVIALVEKIDCFEVVEHTPISPSEANQWFLVFRKKTICAKDDGTMKEIKGEA